MRNMRNTHPRLQWAEGERSDRLHHWHSATDTNGTLYRIKPVYYRGGRFAGYRIRAGYVWLRGCKLTLHDAKASAQRHSNRLHKIEADKYRSRDKRCLDLAEIEAIEITLPGHKTRIIDLG